MPCCLNHNLLVLAGLVGNGAGSLASGLAAGLALTASGLLVSLDAGLLNGFKMLHLNVLPYKILNQYTMFSLTVQVPQYRERLSSLHPSG